LIDGTFFNKIDITKQADIDKIVAMCNTVKLKFSQKGCPSGGGISINFYHNDQLLNGFSHDAQGKYINGFSPNLQVVYIKKDTYAITSGSYDLNMLKEMMGE